MSRTVITEDDLLAEPPAETGATADIPAAPAPAPTSRRGGVAVPAWALAVAGALAILLVGGAFMLGQSGRPSQAEVDATVRDAIREVRDGMREDRAAITKRAVDRERLRLESRHRRELAALRKRLGSRTPVQRAAPPTSSRSESVAPPPVAPRAPVQQAPSSGGGANPAPKGPSNPTVNRKADRPADVTQEAKDGL